MKAEVGQFLIITKRTERQLNIGLTIRSLVALFMAEVVTLPAMAGDTMIGPISQTCRQISGDGTNLILTGMWVVGYVSGVNNLTPTDFLKDRDIGAILDKLRDVCLENPEKTVLAAGRDVIARLRIEAAAERSYKSSRGSKGLP